MSTRKITVQYVPDAELPRLGPGDEPLMYWAEQPHIGFGWMLLWGDGGEYFLGYDFVDTELALAAANEVLDIYEREDDIPPSQPGSTVLILGCSFRRFPGRVVWFRGWGAARGCRFVRLFHF